MKTIKEIIKKLEKLEFDFGIFNSRIAEFAKSTDKKAIDSVLLEKYIKTLKNYKKLSNEYKKEVEQNIGNDNEKEYQAQKELVIFRLEKLNKLFDNNIKKLNIILEAIESKVDLSDKNPEIFDSANSMKILKNRLYDFYNVYNLNLEYQMKYDLNIKLDNNFEEDFEEKADYLDLLNIEINYLNEINNFFVELEALDDEFLNFVKSIKKYKEFFADHLTDFYVFKEKYKFNFKDNFSDFFKKNFDKIFKKNYINKNFNLQNSDLKKDFLILQKILIEEKTKLKIFVNFLHITKKIKHFKELNLKYNIFKKDFFSQLEKMLQEIFLIKAKNFGDFKDFLLKKYNIGLENFKEIIDIFNSSYSYIYFFDTIKTKKIHSFDYGFFNNLFGFIGAKELVGQEFINYLLTKNKKKVSGVFKYFNNFENLNILKEISKKIQKFDSEIQQINNLIDGISQDISLVDYNGYNGLDKTKISVNKKLLLLVNKNSKYYIKLKEYLNGVIYKKYKDAKQSYLNSHYSSSYSGGSYSSYSSGSFSSGSSSFSSSYSSSGSSSW